MGADVSNNNFKKNPSFLDYSNGETMSLFGITFGHHFWPSLLNIAFERHFWTSILNITLEDHF